MNRPFEISELLQAISTSNCEKSYKRLFLMHYEQLVQFSYSILKSTEDAEEVVSDFFVNIWKNREKLPRIDHPKLYFYVSVKNLSLNRLKANKRLHHLPASDEWTVKFNSVFFNPEQLMISAEFTRKIMDCVNTMPPRCKLIFKLIKEEGLKYNEVAQLLDVSVKTVEAQMAIAFKRIKSCLRFENEFPEIHHLLTPKI